MYVFQDDKTYKGAGTFGSFEGLKADMQNTQLTGASGNASKPGSMLVALLDEFPDEIKLKHQAHGSPFVWFEEADGPSKKALTYVGGVDALRAWTAKTFPGDAAIKAAATVRIPNIFNNLTPGFTIPDPLA